VRARTRAVAVLAAVAALTVSLSACQIKAGQAAFVDKSSISETEVASYVNVDAPPPSSGNPGAKTIVVEQLVQRDVLDQVATTLGSVPTDSELAGLHDSVLSTLFQTTVSGQAADAQLVVALNKAGIKASFAPIYIRNAELSSAVSSFLQNASTDVQNQIQAKVAKIDVRINPRYGTWDSSNLAVDTYTPSWLKSA
jgi:hypothetical protein